MPAAGYSGTPLSKKLGFKANQFVLILNQPDYYLTLFESLPEPIYFVTERHVRKDLIHYFALDFKTLQQDLPQLKKEVKKDGCIWISWPKKASKMATDINEDKIRNEALRLGLVDIKVCAVDATWSGLKLVIPLKDRKPAI